ncbi:MAG: GNAT family N-acetyltransferase [Desulfarculaceae bacterium]|nr:GNAT family N-acetyltransferase [Desulfarculaceae bacterium]
MLQTGRNRIHTEKFTLARLEQQEEFRCTEAFDCGLDDLNEFFREDALPHKEQLLAETYYFQPAALTEAGELFPVGFVSFLNDSVHIERDERKAGKKRFWKHLKKSVPFPKRNYESFPAVKIGRLGIQVAYARHGLGTYLLNMTKDLFLQNNRTGCRFITVDAYNQPKVIEFYRKNGFDFLWSKDEGDQTRIMYFDLLRHRKAFA